MSRIKLGLDVLKSDHRRKCLGRRVGLVAHPASTTSDLTHALDSLVQCGAKVEVLFGPEHGFGGEAQDMEPVAHAVSGPGGIPLHSLYGADETSLAPSEEMLAGLDALVVDLFDVGSRYYTFVWTAVLCLRVCHRMGIEMILTDRPNPIGGQVVEGAAQHPDFLSFVGLRSVSNRHGMTVGELVLMAAKQEGLEDALTIIKMEGWNRTMFFDETGLPWIMPSPNMPTLDTASVYPGGCLLEATWVSEGRGTTRPFELFGAPGVDSARLKAALDAMNLPGTCFRQVSFKPGFQKHVGEYCTGLQLHITDRNAFLPYRTGVAVLLALKSCAGDLFRWRGKPYEFVSEIPAIDLLTGDTNVRMAVEQGANIGDVAQGWASGEKAFKDLRKAFLLY